MPKESLQLGSPTVEEIQPEEPVTVHHLVGLHRAFSQRLRSVDSHSVHVHGKLDEIGNLILHLASQTRIDPVDEEGLDRFLQKLVDLEASQRLMFEAGKRMYLYILATREVLRSIQDEKTGNAST